MKIHIKSEEEDTNKVYNEDEFVLCKDKQGNITSCGFSINSLLMREGRSPMMTIQRGEASESQKVSDLFQNLAIPAGIYYMNQPKTSSKSCKEDTDSDSDSDSDDVVSDSIFDKLIALASESKERARATRKMRMHGGKKKSRKNRIKTNL